MGHFSPEARRKIAAMLAVKAKQQGMPPRTNPNGNLNPVPMNAAASPIQMNSISSVPNILPKPPGLSIPSPAPMPAVMHPQFNMLKKKIGKMK